MGPGSRSPKYRTQEVENWTLDEAIAAIRQFDVIAELTKRDDYQARTDDLPVYTLLAPMNTTVGLITRRTYDVSNREIAADSVYGDWDDRETLLPLS